MYTGCVLNSYCKNIKYVSTLNTYLVCTQMEMTYKRINITIPNETLEKLKRLAEKEHRSASNMITYLIEMYNTE